MNLRKAIQLLQDLAKANHMQTIIVGGAIVRLIGPQTAIRQIDEENHTILIDKALNPEIRRHEDKSTTIDIDCIAFSDSKNPFNRDVKQDFNGLLVGISSLQKEYPDLAVSIEPVLYHPYFSRPHSIMQFVSSIESYHADNFFFRLGGIKEDVQKKSLEPWMLTFTDSKETITTLMPTALQKRYVLRGFSIKPKDIEKVFDTNAPFAQFAANFRIKTKGKFDTYLTEWDTFTKRIKTSKQPSMFLKRHIWNLYWNTVGTYFAHGTGIVGKLLLPLGNTLFAGK